MMMKSVLPRAFGMSAVLVLGGIGAALAQTAGENMAYCNKLFSEWSRYNAGSSYSKQIDVEGAHEKCRKGDYSAGIAELTQALQRQQIPVPPVETARQPQ